VGVCLVRVGAGISFGVGMGICSGVGTVCVGVVGMLFLSKSGV